jgi:UDP-2-acetamido-2,6-beta-L-arabino-hexul-4-ose reductase
LTLRILVTGADGFIARNLRTRLRELGHADIVCVTRATTAQELAQSVARADFVFHLAGVNRPPTEDEFAKGNAGFTAELSAALRATGRAVPVAYASSIQAERDNPYGRSKLAAEKVLERYAADSGATCWLFRLANVFGKWSRPNYNSAVATFCHQVTRGIPLTIHDPAAPLKLIHVDDVVEAFTRLLTNPPPRGVVLAGPIHESSVGEIAALLKEFADGRESLMSARVGTGFVRALYSTYVSFLPPESFAYAVKRYVDPRGEFAEMLKTPDCGQFSYFTAHPGVTRGEHYHHTKTEKFLVIRGTAHFGFRNIDSGATHELTTRGGEGRIVETIPGWTHNITNCGDDELVVMLWANEIFDRARPDTVGMKVKP